MRYLILLFSIFLTAQAWASETTISQITEAIEQAPPDSKYQYYQFRARAYSRNNMPEAALADLTASINLNPTVPAYKERTETLLILGRFQEALDDIDIILENVPGDLEMYRLRSKTYFKMEQYREALDDIDIILESDPADLEMYRLRSKSYFEMEQYKEAMEDARRVLAAIPDDEASRLIVMESTTALMPKKDIVMGADRRKSTSTRRVARKVNLKPIKLPKRAAARPSKTTKKPSTVKRS